MLRVLYDMLRSWFIISTVKPNCSADLEAQGFNPQHPAVYNVNKMALLCPKVG